MKFGELTASVIKLYGIRNFDADPNQTWEHLDIAHITVCWIFIKKKVKTFIHALYQTHGVCVMQVIKKHQITTTTAHKISETHTHNHIKYNLLLLKRFWFWFFFLLTWERIWRQSKKNHLKKHLYWNHIDKKQIISFKSCSNQN